MAAPVFISAQGQNQNRPGGVRVATPAGAVAGGVCVAFFWGYGGSTTITLLDLAVGMTSIGTVYGPLGAYTRVYIKALTGSETTGNWEFAGAAYNDACVLFFSGVDIPYTISQALVNANTGTGVQATAPSLTPPANADDSMLVVSVQASGAWGASTISGMSKRVADIDNADSAFTEQVPSGTGTGTRSTVGSQSPSRDWVATSLLLLPPPPVFTEDSLFFGTPTLL